MWCYVMVYEHVAYCNFYFAISLTAIVPAFALQQFSSKISC